MVMRMVAWTGGMLMGLTACESIDHRSAAGRAASSTALGDAGPRESSMFHTTATRSQHRPLASDERRVALVVVPGDASVEVDGQPARRTNGIIELVGKKGDSRKVRVFKGAKRMEEKTVLIGDADSSPMFLDLNAPPPPVARKAEKKAQWEPIRVRWSEDPGDGASK
ncbi:hypothetical protein [Sorangium sp. So ce426]|uniref:hypothetical protein n=1 Tax=Sorangium sp. So ce426 TaxID=3133312 RepID=UPI003F5BC9AC